MLNVKYILSTSPLFKESSVFPLVWHEGSQWIYRNTRGLPRVFMVDQVRVMPHEEMPGYMSLSGFDPSGEVLMSRPSSLKGLSAEGSYARIENYGLNSIEISAHTESPCVMVVSEIFFPAWKATVDGESTDIIRADYCLRAVELEAGDRRITMEYQSSVIRNSLVLSIAALAVSLILAAAGWFRYRRKVG
jgi:hypothetical protein